VARAVAMARAGGALSFIDGVHFAPHQVVDVKEWGCDFLACSAYKFHGPHVGVLYGRREQLEDLDVPKLEPALETTPERMETGTQNHEGIVGAAAAVNYFASLASEATAAESSSRRVRLQTVFDAFHERGSALLKQLWEGLFDIKGVKLFGPPPSAPRTPTLAFTVAGRQAAEVSQLLANRGIFASHGNFYALTVIERLGLADDGLVRLGCACYTTDEEVARVIEAVGAIARA
jgi:selenocysteine lyase/cysteine desulfurase